MRGWLTSLCVACLLSGCPRMVPHDGGVDAGPSPSVDSGYDPATGNAFEGPLVLDDERVKALDPSTLPAGTSPCREPILGRVTSVSDGDTIRVVGVPPYDFDERVRIIGVDTPEIAHDDEPAQCYGEEAKAFTNQLWRHLVWLTFDRECFDHFDRALAYVHVGAGTGDFWERQLLRRGMGRTLTIPPNNSYAGMFANDESSAQASGAGLWSACP